MTLTRSTTATAAVVLDSGMASSGDKPITRDHGQLPADQPSPPGDLYEVRATASDGTGRGPVRAAQRAVKAHTALAGLLAIPALLLTGASAAAADGPGQLCADGNYFVIDYTASYPGSTPARDGRYERAVPTRGGCASSWAHGDGQLSTAAIAAQCRTGIEVRFGAYPFTVAFPGADRHVLRNRADCIELMLGISSGRIDPGVAPLFPGGARP